MTTPGALMAAEIVEQPDVWRRLLSQGRAQFDAVADRITAYDPSMILSVARGTSDHAALYGKYLTEIIGRRPAGLVSPSTMTAYGARPNLDGVLMVGVSQSGGSPDLVQSLEVARGQGALTLAITNQPGSPLAEAAELEIDVMAGRERAVAATKSYTAQLLALFLIIDRLRGGDGSAAEPLPALAEQVVAGDDRVRALAQRYRFVSRLVTTARGYSYATAREAALKLMETSYRGARAFSGADLLHGPLAMIDHDHPVIAVVPDGLGAEAMKPVLERLSDRGADVAVFGGDQSVELGTVGFDLGCPGITEELHPIIDIIPLQQLALEMTLARGLDPDAARGLSKVTQTH
jgi:glutamine---fructose-6-phosphate transaminase (isomerizing)